jgi:RNA-directed DNA polymerase
LQERDCGTPQGSAISPVIANLFMHYAFDLWLGREFPAVEFERYADDGVIHCVSEYQARKVLAALHERMAEVGLALHPDKTRIVYYKDSNRRGSHEHTSFTFPGFTFRPRRARRKDGGGSSSRWTPSAGSATSSRCSPRSWRPGRPSRSSTPTSSSPSSSPSSTSEQMMRDRLAELRGGTRS